MDSFELLSPTMSNKSNARQEMEVIEKVLISSKDNKKFEVTINIPRNTIHTNMLSQKTRQPSSLQTESKTMGR